MTTTEDQRFAPPQAHVEDVAPAEPSLAGRGIRLGAAIIDAVIAGAQHGILRNQRPLFERYQRHIVAVHAGREHRVFFHPQIARAPDSR